jgi:DNA processing protein
MLMEWLVLLRLPLISIAQKKTLVAYFGNPNTALAATPSSLLSSRIVTEPQLKAFNQIDMLAGKKDFEILEKLSTGFIPWNDPGFPSLLNEIPSPPLGLFYKGDPKLLNCDQISIVGSRNASPTGLRTAANFARDLSKLGLVVTSGLASGVDSSAHQGALANGSPTIAVMGTGIDSIYPRSNLRLYEKIVENGLIVTEFPPETPPRRAHFPQRNRIISGLSLGVLVIEAGIRSGSLITARLAAEQGREVFAVPNSIYLPTSRGCHKLIRDGAKLVETIDDIIEETRISYLRQGINNASHYTDPISECDILIYKLIDYAPTPLEYLIEKSGMATERVLSDLLELEMKDLIIQTPGGYQKLPLSN